MSNDRSPSAWVGRYSVGPGEILQPGGSVILTRSPPPSCLYLTLVELGVCRYLTRARLQATLQIVINEIINIYISTKTQDS